MKKNVRNDTAAKRLHAAGNPDELYRILQEECRCRAAKKLATTLSLCPDFQFPSTLSAEQCTSDRLAEIHASMVKAGDRVVDLTCGLGIDAIHISRRAKDVLAIDINPETASALEHNAALLSAHNLRVICGDCTEWIAKTNETFDVAFIDPARRDDHGGRLFSLSDCKPCVTDMLESISRIAKKLIVKMSPMLDLSKVLEDLPQTSKLHILGTTNECKEIVAEVDFQHTRECEFCIHTLDHPTLTFPRTDSSAEIFSGELTPGLIIGEPWPGVMKVATMMSLRGEKLHHNTNIWVNVPEDFPGKRYVITKVEKFSSSNIKRLAKTGPEVSVTVRNFPLKAEELRIRLKAKENANLRLFGVTVKDGQNLLIFATPMR